MSDRFKQTILSFTTDLGGNFLLTALTFLATPLILRLTSDSLYGFWLASISILGYLGLVDLGLGIALMRLVAGIEKTGDRISKVASTAFFSFCVAGLIVLISGLAMSSFIPVWFHIPADESAIVITAYRVAVLAAALCLPLSVFSAIIGGYQRLATTNIARNVVAIVAIGLSIILLYGRISVLALAISTLFSVVVEASINYWYARRYCPQLKIRLSLVNRKDFRRLWSFGGYFQLGKFANLVATNCDSIIIATAMGATFVTVYTFTGKLAILFSITLASKLPIAVFPALSQMFSLNEKGKVEKAFIMLTRYSTRLAIIGAVVLVLTNREFVSRWVGHAFYGGVSLNIVFVYWIIQDTIFRGTSAVIQASGDIRNWAIASIFEAVVNIGASLLLVGPLGLVGVALGTSIARTPSSMYILFYTCRKIGLPVSTFFLQGVLSPMVRSIPGCLIAGLCAYLLPVRFGWFWIIFVGAAATISNLILFEGIELAKPSEVPFYLRLRQVVMRIN